MEIRRFDTHQLLLRVETATLQGINLAGTVLERASLQRADLRGANLQHVSFREARLSEANLAGASLVGASLEGADLIGANLAGADLTGRVDFEGAALTGASEVRGRFEGEEPDEEEDVWVLYPVWDPTDKRRMKRTMSHILTETQHARQRRAFPEEAIVIGNQGTRDLLILRGEIQEVQFWDHETGATEPVLVDWDFDPRTGTT